MDAPQGRPSNAGDPAQGGGPGGSGLAPNVAGALAYFLGALTGILFLIVDRERPFVRFHAMQAILLTLLGIGLSIAVTILGVLLGAIPIMGWLIGLLLSVAVWIGGFLVWLYLMYRAFQGDEWEFPWIGPHARRLATRA